MIRFLSCCLFPLAVLGSATLTQAGAWPRGKGNVFASVAYEWTTTLDEAEAYMGGLSDELEDFGYTAYFLEYGLTDRLSIGIDGGEEDAPDSHQWIAFATYAVSPLDWRHRFAVELGAGFREYPASDFGSATFAELIRKPGQEQVIRPGLSYGYGFDTRWGGGWLAVDARLEMRRKFDEQIPKIDTTLGLAHGKKSLSYVQFQWSDYPLADPNLRIVPTYVYKPLDWLAIENALIWDVKGGDRIGFRAGLWFEF